MDYPGACCRRDSSRRSPPPWSRPIYWDDANAFRQKFYATLGAHITLAPEGEKWSVKVWGENITDTRYDTFYFVSVGRTFLQQGRPWQAGITLRYAIDY